MLWGWWERKGYCTWTGDIINPESLLLLVGLFREPGILEFTFQMNQNNPCPHQLAIKNLTKCFLFSSQFSHRLKIKEKIDVIYPMKWQEQRNQIHDLMGRVDGHWSVYYCRKPPAGWVKSHHPWWPPPWHSEVTPLTIGVVGRSFVELAHSKCSPKSYWIDKQISNFSLTSVASFEMNF